MFLAGDAACFIDPVFSTGVHMATYAGLLAARSVNRCLAGSLDEADAYDEYQRRYSDEYRAQYKFLLAFYDMNRDVDSYFWQARHVLGCDESDNESFIRLVAGAGTVAQDFFQTLHGVGDALASRVTHTFDRTTPRLNTPADFELERADGSSVDLVPPKWRSQPQAIRGASVPGSRVPSSDGLTWEIVPECRSLLREQMLKVVAKPTWEEKLGVAGPELYIRFGEIELCFDDVNLFAFGSKLVKTEHFRAGDTVGWARKGQFSWPDIREVLDQLIVEGVLVRVPA